MDARELFAERMVTPIGTLVLVTDERQHVRATDWDDHEPRMRRLMRRRRTDALPLRPRDTPSDPFARLAAYFDGDLTAIDGIEVTMSGTPFQEAVWRALRRIPAGQTMSYGELARAIEHPTAVRAVGLANGANPIGIIVPCHRVIGANASLTGYGGGLDRKRWLLAHEGVRSFQMPLDRLAHDAG
ncbi:MAG: methylated-DNA--[protein]-cysteine S-methyltransferase [Vicinamibacterales bacterium]